jgi:hypothetical protein
MGVGNMPMTCVRRSGARKAQKRGYTFNASWGSLLQYIASTAHGDGVFAVLYAKSTSGKNPS